MQIYSHKSIKNNTFCTITARSRLRASVLAEEIHFPGKTIYFFLWRCAIFFSIGIPNASRRNCEEFIPFHSLRFLADIFFKIFAIFLARLNLIAYLYHRYDIYVEHSTFWGFAN